MNRPRAIILLAGLGSRLGSPHPKSLLSLGGDETILSRQIRILRSFDLTICGVVGFKKDLVMEAAPDIGFAYNPAYDTTNTAKSLLAGLHDVFDEDVLWLNGDVVFDRSIISSMLTAEGPAVAVNVAKVGEEEVKYNLGPTGFIREISKQVDDPRGEALGINLITAEYLADFKSALARVDDCDYFERAMELLIDDRGDVFLPMDVQGRPCIEVDFAEDLAAAREMLQAPLRRHPRSTVPFMKAGQKRRPG